MFKLLHTGSVKNIYGTEGRSPYIFEFSDRYSVFDWGEMPDSLNQKGEALALMTDLCFRRFENPKFWQQQNDSLQGIEQEVFQRFCETGAAHHGLGLCDEQGQVFSNPQRTRRYAVKQVNVPRDRAGQKQFYQNRPVCALVPLEVIFRFGVPQGSSLLKRAENPAYLKTLGLDQVPKEGDIFSNPIIEFSTKLEPTDRMLSYQEAQEIAGLDEGEMKLLLATTKVLARGLQNLMNAASVKLWDGKFEFAFDENRGFQLVDSIGPDELRLTYEGVQLSKEVLRQIYRRDPWFQGLARAQEVARGRGILEKWKDICRQEFGLEPKPLEPQTKKTIELMYLSLCDALLIGQKENPLFDQSLSLKDWCLAWESVQ